MSLTMADEDQAVGFRFYPTEAELLSVYLRIQLQGGGDASVHRVIPVLEVFDFEPSQLPNLAGERCRGDSEQWFFFVPRQESEARGGRPSRTTGLGYWKSTGSPGPVFSPDNRVIGVKKTMVFYIGKTPRGTKTKWKMNEYKAIDETSNLSTTPKLRHEFSLCRVYINSSSSSAFDRRPMEDYTIERNLPAVPETSYRIPQIAETDRRTSTSHSEGEQVEMVNGLTQPFWEWEQL